MRARWGVTYHVATMLGTAGLAAIAFSRHTPLWDVVGAVLVAFAIIDLVLLLVVAWFQWRHRDE